MLYNRCTGIYKFGNYTYPRRIRRRSNLGHIFQGGGESASYGPGNTVLSLMNGLGHFCKYIIVFLFVFPWRWPKHVGGYPVFKLNQITTVHLLVLIQQSYFYWKRQSLYKSKALIKFIAHETAISHTHRYTVLQQTQKPNRPATDRHLTLRLPD